ncbi:MAG: prolipoprotein diacylglyceryl transferase [Clostridia bacterium]|nr:prolipoprotein diacylglyceryl transferase [Clostridia bacterium]
MSMLAHASNDAFSLFGLTIHWYGLIIAVGLLLALVLGRFNAPRRDYQKDDPLEWILWMLPFAIIGARLYFLIFNGGPWGWEAFAIWNGGLAVYGAIIGGALGAVLYCVVRKKDFLKLADVAVPSLALGQGIGRIGCYFGGCCYGIEVTDPSMQWFPFSVQIDGVWHYSTFFYESFFDLIICLLLALMLRKVSNRGVVFGCYLVLYGIVRALIEGIRGESLMIGTTGIRVSQLLSILLVLAGIGVIIWRVLANKKQQKEAIK